MHADDRPKATLRALIAYGKQRGSWPNLRELRAFRRRLGCEVTVHTALCRLRNSDLVVLRGHTHQARWVPTERAWDLLGRAPFVPHFERERHFADVAIAFLQAIPSPPAPASPHAIRAASAGLNVTE
jgi:hypothetical protein